MAKKVYVKSVLTGGGSDALDGISYSAIQDGEFCFTLYKNQRFFVHYYDASSSASESVPDVIAPDDVGSNNGRWLLAMSRRKICDEDRDTCFETERSTDEDIVRAKAGSQDIFEGYSSGIFSLVKQSGAKMKLSADQTVANATWTKLNIDAYDWDVQSEVDTTNHKWTATKPGKYLICYLVGFDTNSSGDRRVRIYKNGAAGPCVNIRAAADWITNVMYSDVWDLDAGDYLEFYVYQTSGGNLDVLASYTSVVVIKIS